MDNRLSGDTRFLKYFCRLITAQDIPDSDVIDYFDIVQSIAPTKLVRAIETDGDVVSVTVTSYTDSEQDTVYEIVLERELTEAEAEQIADQLTDELDFDFEFETNLEI